MQRNSLLAAGLAGAVFIGACAGGGARSSTSPTTGPSTSASSTAPESMAPMSMAPESMGGGSPAASMDSGSDVMSPAANLRTDLNYLLGEHQILAAKATGAAIGDRQDQFQAYGTLLNTNGTDIGAAIGSIYGTEAQDEFNRIWSAHNGFFVDYTTGVATDDQEMADKAVDDLTTIYVPEFSAFLAGATGLPEESLVDLVTEHVLTTKAIVDAQDSGDAAAAAEADRSAAMHMRMLGDPLAQAIVSAMPDAFRQ